MNVLSIFQKIDRSPRLGGGERDYIALEVIVSKPSPEARMWMEFWTVIKPIYNGLFHGMHASTEKKDFMHAEKDREDDATHMYLNSKLKNL